MNDNKQKFKKDLQYKSRPIDPSKDVEDVMDDTSGRPGVTVKALNDRGNSPMNAQIDKTHLTGGVIQNPQNTKGGTSTTPRRDDPDQNAKTYQVLPEDMQRKSQDIATEPKQFDADRSKKNNDEFIKQEQPSRISLGNNNDEYRTANPPNVSGEESFIGTAPDPEQIQEKDTLDDAHEMGLYPNATEEKPEEIDIARQINKAQAADSSK